MAGLENVVALDLVLTAGCNLKCGYCYQNSKVNRTMDWETLRHSLDRLRESRKKVMLTFYGGEPLLEFPQIRRAVDHVKKTWPRGRRPRYAIVTNGTLLRPDTAGFLAKHRFLTQLSFDGVPEAQDLRGKGTFELLDGLLRRLLRDHPSYFRENVRVSLTLLSTTIRHLAESVAYFIEREVPDIYVNPVVTHDLGWKTEMIEELDRQFERLFRLCRTHYKRTGEVPLEPFRKDRVESVHSPRGQAMCGVGRGEALTVDVDGQVHGCVMFADSFQTFPGEFLRSRLEKMKMGDIKDEGFSDRLALYPDAARSARIFDAKRSKHSSYGRCAECRFLSTCSICPVSIGNIPGNTDPDRVPDFQCAYNLVSRKYRERFPVRMDRNLVLSGRPPISGMMRELEAFVNGRARGPRGGAA